MDKQAHLDKASAFAQAVDEAIQAVFSEEERPIVVLGLQFGEIGHDTEVGNSLPPCLVTSNLDFCSQEAAAEDMAVEAHRMHMLWHGEDGSSPEEIGFPMDAADVPEEVREAARAMAESLGLPPEAVKYIQVPDTSDLDDPQTALNIPLPGDPTGVEGTDAD